MTDETLLNPIKPPALVLPTTRAVVESLLATEDRQRWFADAARVDLVCVHLLCMIPKLASRPDRAAQLVQSALNDLLLQLSTPATVAAFRNTAEAFCTNERVEEGLQWLPEFRIDLRAEREWDAPPPTRADGTLNEGFSPELVSRRLGKSFYTDDTTLRSLALNDRQARIATAILGDPEEPVHIQGFAGTGKTHMIRALLQALPQAHTAVLAKTLGQLQGMMGSLELQDVHHFLFGHFARSHLISAGAPSGFGRGDSGRPDYNISDEQIAINMGYAGVGALSAPQVARAVRAIVHRFCESDAPRVSEDHLTYAYRQLGPPERAALVRYAQSYWDEMVRDNPVERWQPVRHYHLIKLASMVPRGDGGLIVPGQEAGGLDLKFAIVDEAHDLTPALSKLLDNSGVAVYSLGDAFQNLQGTAPSPSSRILRRDMTLSMRAGEGISEVINPVLEAHPRFREMAPLEGSRDLKTRCQFYQVRRIPTTPYAILCGSHFHVFEYLHQLLSKGASVALLPGTAISFLGFVESLFLLRRGERATSSELFQYRDWDALRASYGRMRAFVRIEAMLGKGYSEADFRGIMARVLPMGQGHYTLGRAEDSKNWQFPNVMLSPELFSSTPDARYAAGNLSRVYLAASRAQRAIALPEKFHEWVLQHQKAVRDR